MSDDLVKRLRDRVRYAADRIEALEAARQWRPIESAPRDGTPVLVAVHDGDRRLVGEAYFNMFEERADDPTGSWWWANETPGEYTDEAIHMRWTITHWMPLPSPPEQP
jgi:hypothetical protein